MRIVRTLAELDLDRSHTLGLVPTMGAFHEGHLHLMRVAKSECDTVVCSLFVNPTQFGPAEDFTRYPRNEARDAAMAEEAGVDVLFAPSVEEVYPRKTTRVVVSGVSERWEGAVRAGHFEGVATVVAKLFNMVLPDRAYFGLKDLQQCAVIRRMVEDLNIHIFLRFVETVREKDGLAMSSRNAYLSAEHRAEAPHLNRVMRSTAGRLLAGVPADNALADGVAELEDSGWKVDYLALVDPSSMEPVDAAVRPCRLIAAARIGTTRLIDNIGVIE